MKITLCITLSLITCFLLLSQTGCKQVDTKTVPYDSLKLKEGLTSPELSAEAGIQKMHVEDGFEVKLVAAEPLVVAPVAITFDEKGRIWVVEMQNYMPDTSGTGEDNPIGKVVILSDANGDGVMDHRTVFLDSLILPRAIALIENGILVAEPPRLWHYDIVNDKPTNKTLVDSTYAEGGNVEHQPNGLLRGLDNWIYSAKSSKRYRKKGNTWLSEPTHFRGQWGISQDEDGHLFYNTNSENLLGDYFAPGLGAWNDHQKKVKGYTEKIVEDNHVYPVRPTPGVNRAYLEGIVDDSLRLVNFTAACGPVVYHADLFGTSYHGNVFVAEPSANLIKRNMLSTAGGNISGRQAYENREFLASEDERFRPVNLQVGLDGALYIVDMYRGIIQHKTYITPYLKNEIKQRALSQPLSAGRIYKVVPKNNSQLAVNIPTQADSLVTLLQHANSTVRLKAQHLIVDKKLTELGPALRSMLATSSNANGIIHSLWTLEGLGLLTYDEVLPLLQSNVWRVKEQGYNVLPSVINRNNYREVSAELEKHMQDSLSGTYIGYLSHQVEQYDKALAGSLLNRLANLYPHSRFVADAIISNLKNREAAYLKAFVNAHPDTTLMLSIRLKKVLLDMENDKYQEKTKQAALAYPKGASLYASVCQTCHGNDGNGVAALAPPLNQSDWVTGDKTKLISIVLYGLTGPVKVAGKLYQKPEINGDMPGIGQNKEFTDADIAEVLNYVRNAWRNKATKVLPTEVKAVRKKLEGRQLPFTMKELDGVGKR